LPKKAEAKRTAFTTAAPRRNVKKRLVPHHGGTVEASAHARDLQDGEVPFVIFRDRRRRRPRLRGFGILHHGGESGVLRLELARQRRELPVAVLHGQVLQREPVGGHGAALVGVLAARDLGHHLVARVQQPQHCFQVAPHGVQQLGALELGRHYHQRPIADGVVHERAALGELPVGVQIYALGEPLADAAHVLRVREKFVDLGQRVADYPAVIWRVHAAAHQRAARFAQKRLGERRDLREPVTPRQTGGRTHIVHRESGVGR
jgi:hypothetical protein